MARYYRCFIYYHPDCCHIYYYNLWFKTVESIRIPTTRYLLVDTCVWSVVFWSSVIFWEIDLLDRLTPVISPICFSSALRIWEKDVEHLHIVTMTFESDTRTSVQGKPPQHARSGWELPCRIGWFQLLAGTQKLKANYKICGW